MTLLIYYVPGFEFYLISNFEEEDSKFDLCQNCGSYVLRQLNQDLGDNNYCDVCKLLEKYHYIKN